MGHFVAGFPPQRARIVVTEGPAMAALPWASAMKVEDHEGRIVAQFPNEWGVGYWRDRYKVTLLEIGEEAGQLEPRGA